MKTPVAIVGGGACALMLAATLDPEKFIVTVYDRNQAPGRKFLVAGDGGFNLTHSESPSEFIKRYTPSDFLAEAFAGFSNKHLVQWLAHNGVETFVGSSGRVFPKQGIKPIDVLNKFTALLNNKGVSWQGKHFLRSFSENDALVFEHEGLVKQVQAPVVIFCLGGASWPVTGSAGEWLQLFAHKEIRVHPFRASNCAFAVRWPEQALPALEGKPLKNIALSCGMQTHKGEVVMTRFGLEGSGIYPLSPEIRQQLETRGYAEIHLDLKPAVSLEALAQRLGTKPNPITTSDFLKDELRLSDAQRSLLKYLLTREEFTDAAVLAQKIKRLPLRVEALGPLAEAISTVGGIAREEVDASFQLKKWKHHYAIGEMLDYDAPTGGYLLQSCFSMGWHLANHLNLTHF